MQSNPVATNQIQLTHIGRNQLPINTGTPVTSLNTWISATIPKIVPAIRSQRFFEFILIVINKE